MINNKEQPQRNKTSRVNCFLAPAIKKMLLEKAREHDLTITGFIEKVATTDLIFIDDNVKKFSKILKVEVDKS